ncbi:unnamed protein product [Sphagnum jensenii]
MSTAAAAAVDADHCIIDATLRLALDGKRTGRANGRRGRGRINLEPDHDCAPAGRQWDEMTVPRSPSSGSLLLAFESHSPSIVRADGRYDRLGGE